MMGWLAILLTYAVGHCMLKIIWPMQLISPNKKGTWPIRLLKFSLACSFGIGLTSCTYFVSLFLRNRLANPHLYLDLLLLLGLCLTLFLKFKTASRKTPDAAEFKDELLIGQTIHWPKSYCFLLKLVFVFIVAQTIFSLTRGFYAFEYGGYDAYMIWNLRAKFLYLAGQQWPLAFAKPLYWSHTDYPLLLPCSVARLWHYFQLDTTLVPRLLSPLATTLTTVVLFATLWLLRSSAQAMLAVIVLLSFPFFVLHSSSQYGEPLLGFFMIATVSQLVLFLSLKKNGHQLLIGAGLACGCAAWTKNEGLAFVAACLMSGLIIFFKMQGWRGVKLFLKYFLLGLSPILLTIMMMKWSLDYKSDLLFATFQQHTTIWQRAISWSFQKSILASIWHYVFNFRESLIFVLLPCYMLLAGFTKKKSSCTRACLVGLVLLFLYGSYYAVYTISPRPITHIAMARLFSNGWPCLVLFCFLVIQTPEQWLSQNKQKHDADKT